MGLWRVHVEIEDRPGRLGGLAAAVGADGCNIVSLTVLGERGPDGSVTDELLVDAADEQAAAELADEIRAAGMGCTLAVPAGADELRDPVTTGAGAGKAGGRGPGCGGAGGGQPAARPATRQRRTGRLRLPADDLRPGHPARQGLATHRDRAVQGRRADRVGRTVLRSVPTRRAGQQRQPRAAVEPGAGAAGQRLGGRTAAGRRRGRPAGRRTARALHTEHPARRVPGTRAPRCPRTSWPRCSPGSPARASGYWR